MSDQMEIMRVLRTLPKGELRVEANGQQLADLAGLNKRRRFLFLTAVGELIDFVGGYQQLVDAGVAPLLVSPSQTAVSIQPEEEEETLTPEQQAFLDRLEQEKNILLNDDSHVKEPSIIRTAIPLRRPSKPQKIGPPSPKSIVEQIDEVLQTHVQQHEHLAERSIHLRKGPQGKTQIEVDGKLFANPNELEEVEIRQLIQQAVQDWESR